MLLLPLQGVVSMVEAQVFTMCESPPTDESCSNTTKPQITGCWV